MYFTLFNYRMTYLSDTRSEKRKGKDEIISYTLRIVHVDIRQTEWL